MTVFKVQKWIPGWGWATIGITPNEVQAQVAIENLHAEGKRARVVAEEEQIWRICRQPD